MVSVEYFKKKNTTFRKCKNLSQLIGHLYIGQMWPTGYQAPNRLHSDNPFLLKVISGEVDKRSEVPW